MQSRHINVGRIGGSEVLELGTQEVPPPSPGEARVRVVASGVSFGDVLLRVGVIPVGPKPPFTPGFDVTGVVEALGEGVTDLQLGQYVTALVRSGGYSELANLPAERLVPVPEGVDAVEAAAAALNYFVAYQMLHRIAKVGAGQRVLIHGAAGGVGTAFLQLGRLAELECHGTSSSAKRTVVTEFGGEHIDYQADDFVNVMRSRARNGIDAVFDPVGGTHFLRSYRVLRRGGSLVGYGQSQAFHDGEVRRALAIVGFIGGIGLPKLIPDGRRTTFYNAWSLEKSQPTAYREDLGRVLRLLAEKEIRPAVAEAMPMTEAAKAHDVLERAEVSGKIVLVGDTDG